MSRRFFSHNKLTGVTQFWHDLGDGRFAIESVQDVEGRLERNKALANHGDGGFSEDPDKWLKRIASIPNVVVLQWLKEGLDVLNGDPRDPEFKRKLAAKLNDPDYRYLRTAPGRV